MLPFLPKEWKGYAFQIQYRGRIIRVSVQPEEAIVELLDGQPLSITLCGEEKWLEDRITHSL